MAPPSDPESYGYEQNFDETVKNARMNAHNTSTTWPVVVINAACVVASALMVVAASIRDLRRD